jgi:hypothetical protein
MKIIFVCVGNFQEYILDNIKNLKLFKNNDIVVITESKFFHYLCIDFNSSYFFRLHKIIFKHNKKITFNLHIFNIF